MFAVGDIVRIYAPQVGYYKYHLCIVAGDSSVASRFLYLNSDPTFAGTYVVDCSRVPCLPSSTTGKTAFSFAAIPRYSDKQLGLYQAQKMGELDKTLAAELHVFAANVKTLNAADRAVVLAALGAVMA
jgi:hypothetical protein